MERKKLIKTEYKENKKAEKLTAEVEIQRLETEISAMNNQWESLNNGAIDAATVHATFHQGDTEPYNEATEAREELGRQIKLKKAELHKKKAELASKLLSLKEEKNRKLGK